jgi:hypothetical protein
MSGLDSCYEISNHEHKNCEAKLDFPSLQTQLNEVKKLRDDLTDAFNKLEIENPKLETYILEGQLWLARFEATALSQLYRRPLTMSSDDIEGDYCATIEKLESLESKTAGFCRGCYEIAINLTGAIPIAIATLQSALCVPLSDVLRTADYELMLEKAEEQRISALYASVQLIKELHLEN